MVNVRFHCVFVIEKLIYELGNCFFFHELMHALGVVYPQYWLGPNLETFFQLHLDVIKDAYCVPKKCGPKEVWISLVSDPMGLIMQHFIFVPITMKNNCNNAMFKYCSLNPFQILVETINHIPNCCAKDVKVYQVG
jgi:hypothetical protein